MKIELVDLATPLNSEDTESEDQKEKLNVCERFKKTSILSQLFFIWVLPLFNLSKNKTLNFDNLTNGIKIPFNTNISQRHILIPQEKLNEYYYDKNKKTYHRLFLTILLANIKEITLVLILSLFLTSTRIGQIILLKKIIVIFEEPYKETFAYNLIFYSMILVVVKLSQIIVNHYNNYKTQINFIIINNYFIFFMILFLNLSKSGIFIKTIFDEQSNFFQSLIKLIKKLDKKDKQYFFGIINNLFLEEYKFFYFKKNSSEKDESLENIFIKNQLYFSNFFNDSEEGFGINERC